MPNSEAFHVGPFNLFGLTIDFSVRWYGIMIMLGVIAASYIAYTEARRRKEDPDHVWQLFPWVLIFGILGARLGWVISEAGNREWRDVWQVFAISEGGLSIQGAVIGGALALIVYCMRYKLSFFKWADIIVPGVAMGQVIGRLGNYFNQEAFGRPTTLPWGIEIDVRQQAAVAGPNPGFTPSSDLRFHPTFAYEMIWNFLNFSILMWLGRQRRIRLREGDILWFYLIFYSIGRYAIEEIRVDSAMVSGFKTPQLFALATIFFAVIMIAIRHRPGSPARLAESNLHGDETLHDEDETVSEGASPARIRKVARANRRTTSKTTGASTE